VRYRTKIPAKINLHLQVLGLRSDGYHEVRTLLHSIDLFDEISVDAGPEGIIWLEVEPPGAAPDGEDNLVVAAAHHLWDMMKQQRGARIRLHKRIPVGGGLGGGSGDAAATLVLLNALRGVGASSLELYQLAARLGSDVPFFLQGGLALGVGRGDEVYRLPDVPRFGVVVAAPDARIPTSDVYERLRSELTWTSHEANVYSFAAEFDQQLRWDTMWNDLQPEVVDGWPIVADVLSDLEATDPLRFGVSGSGAAAFAVYPDQSSAERAGAQIGTKWWTHVGQGLDRRSARPVAEPEEGMQ